MKKINILVSDAFLFPGGGQEGTVLQILKLLDREKFNITFATWDDAQLPSDFPSDIMVNRVGMKSKIDFGTCFKIRKIVNQQKIDVINVHGFRASLLIRLAYLFSFKKVKIIYTAQVNYEQLKNFSNSKSNMLSVAIGNILDSFATNRIAFVSKKNMDVRLAGMPRVGAKKCMVIYNGVTVSNKQSLNKEQQNDKTVIACLSALVKRKGIHILIDAAKILDDKKSIDFEIKIGGKGVEMDGLKARVEELGLGNRVKLIGYTNREALLGEANIFVLPTFSEGFPLSILEAGLFKLPVVASGVDGIPEVIAHNDNGLLVNPGNAIELANALQQLIEDKKLQQQLGNKLFNTVSEKFSEKKLIENYSKLFEEIIEE